MVIAHHLVWTAYGWWLPNDPRGSTSHEIRCDLIADLGRLHHGRKTVQPASADIRAFYEQARRVLKHPLLVFDAGDCALIAGAFADAIRRCRYTCYACAIMLDHVHVLIRKHRDQAEQMIAQLQQASRSALADAGGRWRDHPVWGGPGWKVFQDSPEDVGRTVKYIEDNPPHARLPGQHWPFVVPYDQWPLHKRFGEALQTGQR